MYDVIKCKTGVNKKSATLDPAVQGGKTGEQIYLLPYSTQKSVEGQTGTITKVDTISNESLYYTLNMKTTEKTVSCPIMNAEGQVICWRQKNTEADSPESYAIGISSGKCTDGHQAAFKTAERMIGSTTSQWSLASLTNSRRAARDLL